MYYRREAEQTLLKLSKTYPVVAIVGPRQSGKTTMTQALFKEKKYISLEDLDQRTFAKEDPRNFLTQSDKGLLLDEIQNSPELFSYIQGIVDRNKKPGEFILTGSHQFEMISKITQSLAGRVGLIELLPFSISEIKRNIRNIKNLDLLLYKGFYPSLYDRAFEPHIWYEDYVRTYIERDVRKLINIKDLSLFQKFLKLCAARSGSLINFSEISNAVGVDTRTIKTWMSVLEASYIIFLLKPHHKNFSKKLVKAPKLYFYDPGLMSYLLSLRKADMPLSTYRGSLFESMIISECYKHNKNHRRGKNFYFWRNNKGIEIDLIFEKKEKLFSLEIKSGATLHTHLFKNLKMYQKHAGSDNIRSLLIYGGREQQKRNKTHVLPWFQMDQLFKSF